MLELAIDNRSNCSHKNTELSLRIGIAKNPKMLKMNFVKNAYTDPPRLCTVTGGGGVRPVLGLLIFSTAIIWGKGGLGCHVKEAAVIA